jgi:hypothetical protein
MRHFLNRLLSPTVLLVIVGCAAGGGALTGFREQLGVATPNDLGRETRLVLERYQFEMEREDSSLTYQVFSTRWKGRTPFQDELDSGVVEAMTRVVVTGRSRGGGGSATSTVQVVEFVAENRVMYESEGEWQLGLATPLFREYVGEIANELKSRLTQGIRVR